jgi:RNA polymerase sigma-70 factor (ECF subfamily)
VTRNRKNLASVPRGDPCHNPGVATRPHTPRDSDFDFAAAYAVVAPALHAWARLRVRGAIRSRLEPDDLVQEIALRSCLRASEFDPQLGTFRSWLFGFAYRVWLEALRELGRDPLGAQLRPGGDSRLPGIPDSVTAISRRIANDEALRAALVRLDALPDDDRDLLVHLGIEGMTHAETATLLGIGEETSRKRWQRLRVRLLADADLVQLVGGLAAS